jgi:hypothetical protein
MDQRIPAIPIARDRRTGGIAHDTSRSSLGSIGSQPIALAGAVLTVMLIGVAAIALWRAYTGTSPESDHAMAVRAFQARAMQASEQLVEKTKGLEVTQQESIDQLQEVQDQLSSMRQLLATQQSENKRLSDQVTSLTEAVDGLRQSFASTQQQPSESAGQPARNRVIRARAHHAAGTALQQRRVKTHS